MSALVEVVNDNGNLVVSDNATTYSYIGRATLVSVAQAGGTVVSRISGFSTYYIDWPGDIIVALPIKNNKSCMVRSQTKSGNRWTIQIFASNNTKDSQGFSNQEATEVYVFGEPLFASGWGFALYRADATCCADFTKKPLMFGAIITATDGTLVPMPSNIAVPGVIGSPINFASQSVGPSNNTWVNTTFIAGWAGNSNNTNLALDLIQLTRVTEDQRGYVGNLVKIGNAMVLDLAKYN